MLPWGPREGAAVTHLLVMRGSNVMFQSVVGRGGYGATLATFEPHYGYSAAAVSTTYNYYSPWSSSLAAAAGPSPWQPTVNNSPLFVANCRHSHHTGLQWSYQLDSQPADDEPGGGGHLDLFLGLLHPAADDKLTSLLIRNVNLETKTEVDSVSVRHDTDDCQHKVSSAWLRASAATRWPKKVRPVLFDCSHL